MKDKFIPEIDDPPTIENEWEPKAHLRITPPKDNALDQAQATIRDTMRKASKILLPVATVVASAGAFAVIGWLSWMGMQFLFSVSPLLAWSIIGATAAQAALMFLAYWSKSLQAAVTGA
jgi:hypothetical protein